MCEYIETRPDTTVPHAGGRAATVVVTMTPDALLGGLAATSLHTGTSQVLDLARKTCFHTEPHASPPALALRDRGCTPQGCDWPPDVPHPPRPPWHRGGNTDTKTGRLLCPRHQTNPTAPGKLRFIKRT